MRTLVGAHASLLCAVKIDLHDIFISGLVSPAHALLACRRIQMVNQITLCISLGGMLDTTDLSVPSGTKSSPVGKSSQRDSLALCSSAQ